MFGRCRPDPGHIPPEDIYIRILTFFSGSERYVTEDMPLADVTNDNFEEAKFQAANIAFELTLSVDITGEMIDLARISGMTVGEFARAVARLPKIRDCLQIARFVGYASEAIVAVNADDRQ